MVGCGNTNSKAIPASCKSTRDDSTDLLGRALSPCTTQTPTELSVGREAGCPLDSQNRDFEISEGPDSDGGTCEKFSAECGNGAVGAKDLRDIDSGTGVLGQKGDPGGIPTSTTDSGHSFVVDRVSINAVTILAPVTIFGKALRAVVDSGAAVSILSSREYYALSEEVRPAIRPSQVRLMVADSSRCLAAEGVVFLEFTIDDLEFEWPVYVAPIADSLLLGCDVLDGLDFLVSSRRGLMVRGKWVPCDVTRQPLDIRNVTVVTSQPVKIPANHEMVVQVPSGDLPLQSERFAVLEPLVEDQRGLMVARCLIDVWRETIPVRLMNISNEPIQLNRGYPIGELQLVEEQVKDVGVVDVPVRMVRAEDSSGGSGDQTGMESTTDTVLPEEKRQSSGQANEDEETVVMATIQQEADELPEYLRGLYQNCSANLSCAERQQLRCILNRRKDAFARNKLDLGCYNGIEHEINTACAAPVRQRVRPTPKGFEDEAKKCLEEQLETGVVRPSSSAWASPTVLVRKADGSVRYCVDFRKVNDRTVKDAYPLPRIDMCLDSLGNIKYFSTLDLQSGYWQIRVKESDIPKTAFITKYGLFEYTKMPFGLCNAGSSFQRCMELIFRGLQWQTLLIYLDDIIILGRDINENLDRLDEALGRLEAAGLKLKPKKCQILQEEVLFLGHQVSASGIRPNPKLIECIMEWKRPRNRREVQQYLGLCNYYRRFIPEFSDTAAPLTELTSKHVDFRWSEAAEESFLGLKNALCSAPILAFPLEDGEFVLDTDASNLGIGGVLQQRQGDDEKVIAYTSKKLNKQQRRYCVTRRELLAIVVCLREFRNHLLGREFTIRTDHGSLAWLLNFKEPQGQLARWLEYIFQFRFHIVHRDGKKHTNADALSRNPAHEEGCNDYRPGVALEDLPCGGCSYCRKHHEEWGDFHNEVDDVVPLSQPCRQVFTRSQTKSS